jgi:ubiquinone/menaquinone biosynthesis C-methylase UbiE
MRLVTILNFYNKFFHYIYFDNHRNFRSKIIKINKAKDKIFYDYGESFFYQSVPDVNLRGLRDTKKRIEKLNLNKYLNDKVVLDIGTNIGAIPITANQVFKKCLGVDHNTDAIKIALEVKKYLQLNKIEFFVCDFLEHNFDEKFDVILSLANHSTFDKGIKDTNKYLKKISDILNIDGILVFESHSPLYEDPKSYLELVEQLKKNFKVIETGKYEFGNFYDKNRIFHILKKVTN